MGVPVVDVHAHAMPLPLLHWMREQGLADLSRLESDSIAVIDPRVSGVGAGAPLPVARGMYDNEVRLAEMDAQGVDHHAISLPPFLMGSTCDDAGLVVELVRRGNDALAELVAGQDRLHGLVGVPVGFPDAAAEVRRGLGELGMRGAAIGSRGAGRDLDDPVNAPVWELLSQRQVFTFLHPSGVPDGPRLKDYWFPQLVGYPMETAIATARLAFGVLEKTPFPLCLAHGGGCLPSLRGRLDMGWDRKPVTHVTSVPPSRIFDRLYYDTAVFDDAILRRILEDVGPGQVLTGTDYPFDLAERDPVGVAGRAGLAPQDLELVLGTTAARLLGL